ncbi:recombinase family protein [Mesorhizobium sp. B1-1-5]|uniref:recombinase family protein n=1 Tax=Mesorhizobium sp. B1-1-5 TaxID=2589979 RepID=UPI001129563C|nr:recombinase family protein [Mesorhizobium sp. B1-1-5]TPO05174.1 recombinase family protein [Mesorhizobium sp. B1-1-5]
MTKRGAQAPRAYSYIRMSTETQLNGDSRRRQLELSERYAQNHGLELVEEFRLEDIGVSAFRGANLAVESSLGRFLISVRKGEVPSGSYLLLESLDRLSRQDVFTSLSLFTDLIKAGIKIVTLADDQVYTSEKTDFSQLVVSLAIMSRAHEESLTKSRRLAEAWTNKRRGAYQKKLTRLAPSWLDLSSDRTSFQINEDRASVVRSMFDDAAAGLGTFSIARRLNRSAAPPFGRSKGWQTSYVSKILTNRATIGEYQPHKMVDGRRMPEGEPIRDYFPAIVDEQLFLRVQGARANRRTGGAGRKGEFVSNLFSGLAKCAYCGSPMHYVNKGPGSKGGTYLVCDKFQRGIGCSNNAWRYGHFEASFLTFVEEVDLRLLIQGDEETLNRSRLDKAVHMLDDRLAKLEQERGRTFQLLLDPELASDFVRKEFARYQREIEAASAERGALVAERRLFESDVARFQESSQEIQDLVGQLRKPDGGGDMFRLRSRVVARFKALVDRVEVAALGIDLENASVVSAGQFPSTVGSLPRQFAVIFRDGGLQRIVQPIKSDPATGETQLLRSIEPKGRWMGRPAGERA